MTVVTSIRNTYMHAHNRHSMCHYTHHLNAFYHVDLGCKNDILLTRSRMQVEQVLHPAVATAGVLVHDKIRLPKSWPVKPS